MFKVSKPKKVQYLNLPVSGPGSDEWGLTERATNLELLTQQCLSPSPKSKALGTQLDRNIS